MDGGRVLRAFIWRLRGDRLDGDAQRGDRWAASSPTCSSASASSSRSSRAGIVSGLWLALIGWFLSNAAEATLMQAGVERSLSGVRVRDAMDPNPPAVSPNETVAELVNERMLRGEDRSYLVRHDDGGLAGHRHPRATSAALARDDWPIGPRDRHHDPLRRPGHHRPRRAAGRCAAPDPGARGRPAAGGRAATAAMPLGMVTRRGILRLIDARMKLGLAEPDRC